MTQGKMFRLRFKDSDIEYEIEGDKAFVEEQSKALSELYQASLQQGGRARGRGNAAGRDRRRGGATQEITPQVVQAIQDFLRESRPKGSPDIALTAGYFLTYEGNASQFSTRDLTLTLEPIRNLSVGNMSLAVRRAVERGYLIEHKRPEGGRSTYSISDKGKARVESHFV